MLSFLVALVLVAALFFFAVGTLGILRFPDFYTRLHAAGKCDTLASMLALFAVALFTLQDWTFAELLVSLKILAIAGFRLHRQPHRLPRDHPGRAGAGRRALGASGGQEMIWQLDLLILTLLVICAIGAITVRDLLSATMIFGAYSFLMCLLWAEMGAVDVAFTEATVGAGVSTILFIAAILRTSRRSKD